MTSVLFSSKFSGDLPLPLGFLSLETQMDPERYALYKLIEVDHYKEKDNVGHEFLVLQLDDDTGPLLLRVERRPSARKPGQGGPSSSNGSPYIRITDDSISRLSPSLDLTALSHIAKVRCTPESGLTLLNVAKIYDGIAKASPNYDLLREQCYWFAITFVSRLTDLPGVVEDRMSDYHRRGNFAGHIPIVSRVRMKTRGTSLNLSLNPARGETKRKRSSGHFFSALFGKKNRKAYVESTTDSEELVIGSVSTGPLAASQGTTSRGLSRSPSLASDDALFSGSDAAIMAEAFRKMLRRPSFGHGPTEEGDDDEQDGQVTSSGIGGLRSMDGALDADSSSERSTNSSSSLDLSGEGLEINDIGSHEVVL